MKLTVLGGELSPAAPTTLESDEENVVLGRQPARGLTVNDPTVSREHARIFKRGAEFQVADLNSSNGTFVNGVRVTRSALRPGDTLRLGSVDLRFEGELPSDFWDEPNAAATPSPADAGEIDLEAPGDVDEIRLEDPNPIDQTVIAVPIRTPTPPPRPAAARPAPPRRPTSLPLTRDRASGGVLKQDIAQQSFGQKLILIVVALAIAAAVFFVVQRMTESVVPEGGLPPVVGEDGDLDGANGDGG